MKQYLLFLALLLLAGPALGADGDVCADSDNAAITLFDRGRWTPTACIQLCDGKVDADTACTEYDFNNNRGMPEVIIFEYEENPDSSNCDTDSDFTLTTGPISVVATANAPTYNIDPGGAIIMNSVTNRVVLVTRDYPLDRFLFTAISANTNCDDVDIRMFFYNQKTGLF